jgi:uncharacterized membrane protein YuzA (DUF378 family)
MKAFNTLTEILTLVGALNWGLVGVFGFDLVAALFGPMSVPSRIVYALVGISAVYRVLTWGATHNATGRRLQANF